jgi:hypothetical protein
MRPTLRNSDLIGLGCSLGRGNFRQSLDDSHWQPRLRITVLVSFLSILVLGKKEYALNSIHSQVEIVHCISNVFTNVFINHKQA